MWTSMSKDVTESVWKQAKPVVDLMEQVTSKLICLALVNSYSQTINLSKRNIFKKDIMQVVKDHENEPTSPENLEWIYVNPKSKEEYDLGIQIHLKRLAAIYLGSHNDFARTSVYYTGATDTMPLDDRTPRQKHSALYNISAGQPLKSNGYHIAFYNSNTVPNFGNSREINVSNTRNISERSHLQGVTMLQRIDKFLETVKLHY